MQFFKGSGCQAEGHPGAGAASWPCHSRTAITDPHPPSPTGLLRAPATASLLRLAFGKPRGARGGPDLCSPRASGPGTSLYMRLAHPTGAQVCGRAAEVAEPWECGRVSVPTRPWVPHLLPSQRPELLPVFCRTVPLSQQLPGGGHVSSPFCSPSLKLTMLGASCLGPYSMCPSVTRLAHLA